MAFDSNGNYEKKSSIEKDDYYDTYIDGYNDQDYVLSVSQFAKLCGTTRDTLRYYYEQDIISPKTNPLNGYHYYSASQISSFFFVSTMRQAGCSIKEISYLINNSSKDSIKKLTNAKILDMQKELFLINKRISALHLGMWILDQYDANKPYTPFLDELPDISVTKTLIENSEYAYHTGDIANDISRHLSQTRADSSLSAFPAGVTISYDSLLKKNYVYNSIISLSFLPSDGYNSFALPTNRAVSCYHEDDSVDIEKTYQKMVSYIKKNRLKACSDLYIISLINLYDKEKTHRYFKYMFICV